MKTLRDVYEAALIEINKLEAPHLLLEDFNYLINKAIQQTVNKVYNRYEYNQQATDDFRILKSSAILSIRSKDEPTFPNEIKDFFVYLPSDYFHILNCVVEFEKQIPPDPDKCPNQDGANTIMVPARKLTSDMYPSILVNYYYRPDIKRPYFFINNERGYDTYAEASELERILHPCTPISPEEVVDGIKMQIRCGKKLKYAPKKVYIDYIREPKKMELSHSDLELVNGVDKSMKMEFPDYVCYEIINELVKLVMENASDPRLQTNLPINKTIATPSDN